MQKLIFINGNGKSINLTEMPFGIINWNGLANTELNVQGQQVPFQDGSVFLDALLDDRTIELTLSMCDNNDLNLRYELRRALISALNPKLGEGTLIYTNDYLSKQIKAIPEIPLFENHNSNDSGTPKVGISFICCNPYWEDVEETNINLNSGEVVEVENTGDIETPVEVNIKSNSSKEVGVIINNESLCISDVEDFNTIKLNTALGNKTVKGYYRDYNLNNFWGNINGIAYSEKLNIYVTAGSYAILYSEDKENWFIANSISGNINTTQSVIWIDDLNIFVSVGSSGAIYTSSDGKNWILQTSNITSTLQSVCYNEKLKIIIAVGNLGVILTSTDGITWTQQTSGVSVTLFQVRYIPEVDKIFACGGNTVAPYNNYIISSSDCVSWQINYNGAEREIRGVAYSSIYEYMACGFHFILTSTDGTTWTQQTNNYSVNDIKFIPEYEAFFLTSQGEIIKTIDGINFEEYNNNTVLKDFIYIKNKGLFLFYGNSTSFGYSYSYKNVEFYKISIISAHIYSACVVNNKIYVAANNKILISENGKDYTIITTDLSSSIYLLSICYSEELSLFVAVGYTGSIITSSDGITWTQQTSGVSVNLNKIIWIKEKNTFIIVGNSGTILTSTDAVTWTQQTSGITNNINDVAYSKDLEIVCASATNRTLTSSDLITWAEDSVNVGSRVVYSEKYKKFFLFSSTKNYTSSDGVTWIETIYNITLSNVWDAKEIIINNVNTFVICSNGYIAYSVDGQYWTKEAAGISREIDSVILFNNILYFYGEYGLMLYESESEGINIINHISNSLTLKLEKGINKVILFGNDNIIATLTYKNKYIGV